MTSLALRLPPRRSRRRKLVSRRHRRRVDQGSRLLSVAGAVGSPVVDASGARVGLLDDLVVRWDPGEPHPRLHGALVRVRRTRAFVPAASISDLRPDRIQIAGVLGRDPGTSDPGLIALAHDVLDRQIVDVDGVDIVRVSDLALGPGPDGFRLLGVDVSGRTLLRRLGPRRLRRRVAVGRVYDWASVGAFSVRQAGEAGSVLKLTDAATRLRELGPRELRALLVDLPPEERGQVGAHLATGRGA